MAEPKTEKSLYMLDTNVFNWLLQGVLPIDVPGAGFDEGRWTDGKLANDIRAHLDREKKKRDNMQDALIAETAITKGFTLITCDDPLRRAAEAHGCRVLFF